MAQEEQDNGLGLEMGKDVAEGVYVNFSLIAHSGAEFVIDFARFVPGVSKGVVKSRVVMTPECAQRLLGQLSDHVKRFEEQHGPINRSLGKPYPYGTDFGGEA